jgi:hypothetical protein
MSYWNFESGKINYGQSFEFFTTANSDFLYIYLSLVLKLSDIRKNTKFPKSHFISPLIKMSYSYFIFNFDNVHHYFIF